MTYRYIKSFFLLLFFSFHLVAEQVLESAPEMARLSVVSYQEQIDGINQEIKNLGSLEQGSNGDDKLALQLYMFRKNQEIRKIITTGINDPEADKAFFIEQIQQQQEYAKQKIQILSKRANELVNELNDAKNEEKLSVITQYREIRSFLDNTYKEQAENIDWLNQLQIDVEQQLDVFKRNVSMSLEQIAANIQFLNQKEDNQNHQLQDAPEAEKENVSLAINITKRQIDIATDSLQIMMNLAEDVAIDTAQYRRLYFDTTGSVTHDLLNKDVLSSIIGDWSERSWSWMVEHTPKLIFQLLVAFIILFITYQIAAFTRRVLRRMVANKNLRLSQLMQDFFVAISGRLVWVIGFLIALSQIGINLGPVLAGFGIAGVIVGFALQDTLSNFAAGMMLLIYRPFDVGDFVLAGGVEGKVSHMSLVNTTIKTFDNQIIIVPNSKIWGDVIKNVTHERVRRVDMVFGVSYSDDVEVVEKVLMDIIISHPSVLKTPEPVVKVGSLGDSSVNFLVRPWVHTDDYWDVLWDVTREVKIRFDKEGISIPFPQQDIHLYHGVEKALYMKKNHKDDPSSNEIVKQ